MESSQQFLFDKSEHPVAPRIILEPLLTVKDVADILKISPAAVRIEVKRGKLCAHRIGPKGGVLRFQADSIRSYVEGRKIFVKKSS